MQDEKLQRMQSKNTPNLSILFCCCIGDMVSVTMLVLF